MFTYFEDFKRFDENYKPMAFLSSPAPHFGTTMLCLWPMAIPSPAPETAIF